MPLRKSTQIAIGFAVIALGGYFGYQAITDQMIMNEKFTSIKPGAVNLVGLDRDSGYRIIVANYIAQLVEASTDFHGNETDDGGATSGAIKKRVPVREMLDSMRGDAKALGIFTMFLNEMQENDRWPTTHVVWKSEDIQKALEGDAELKKRLESNLNMHLDGMPLAVLDFDALANGIIIDTPVTVTVNIEGHPTPITGRVQEPYRPRMIKAVEERYQEKGNITRQMQMGYYREEAEKIIANPQGRENIAETLKTRIDPNLAKQRAEAPSRVLESADIIVNESFITGASFREYKGPDSKNYYDITLQVSDEGRRRLWQFSKKRIGDQLLLTANGIPIAAPRIRTELSQGQFTITQMQDRNLVEEAVNMINENAKRVAGHP